VDAILLLEFLVGELLGWGRGCSWKCVSTQANEQQMRKANARLFLFQTLLASGPVVPLTLDSLGTEFPRPLPDLATRRGLADCCDEALACPDAGPIHS